MPRYKLILEYDGTHLVGWQKQTLGTSVQSLLEAAFVKFVNSCPTLIAAGRTDAGVHATGQVVHCDLMDGWLPFQLQQALNAHLKDKPVSVIHVAQVADDFHARFSATHRSYAYRIINRYAPLALEVNRAWLVRKPLDVGAMQQAAQLFMGTHDFQAFRASACQAQSSVKTLDYLSVRSSQDLIEIYVKARSFLHHQVRNMVGALVWVGLNKWNADRITQALQERTRTHGAPTAPACGLYFLEAGYPVE